MYMKYALYILYSNIIRNTLITLPISNWNVLYFHYIIIIKTNKNKSYKLDWQACGCILRKSAKVCE